MTTNEIHSKKDQMLKKNLTVAEISSLWATYQRETLAKCAITFFLQHIEDQEIREILEHTLSLSNEWIDKSIHFLREDQYPIPKGFTEDDVKLSAPRLFSDKLYLEYVYHIAKLDMGMNFASVTSGTRLDIVEFYEQALAQSTNLFKKAKELLKHKGYYLDYPTLPNPKDIEFVSDDSFLSGWFGERRPLLGMEVSHLISNAKHNAIGQAVIIGFAQVAKSKEVKDFFQRGKDIALKHLKVFRKTLSKENLPDSAPILTAEVSDSTNSPFSDKLMLFFITSLIQAGIGYYGVSMAESSRRDVALNYARLATEIAKYAEDGFKLLIKHGWFEEPPITLDREKLSK